MIRNGSKARLRGSVVRKGKVELELGIFCDFPPRVGVSESQTFSDWLHIIKTADGGGLDVAWIAELHLDRKRSISSSPLLIACMIAQHTARVKLGIGVQILPLGHPLRLAEEIATADHMTSGRLIVGLGRSGFPKTYETFGIPYGESQSRFSEVLEILLHLFSKENVTHQGKFYRFENVTLAPKPLQSPHPPFRVAASSPGTSEQVGALGYPVFLSVRRGTLDDLKAQIDAYHQAREKAGHVGRGLVYVRIPVYVSESESQAREECHEGALQLLDGMGAQIERTAGMKGTKEIEGRAKAGSRLRNMTYDQAIENQLIVGSPRKVIERLAFLKEAFGVDGIAAEISFSGHISHIAVMRSLRLFCDEIVPKFSKMVNQSTITLD